MPKEDEFSDRVLPITHYAFLDDLEALCIKHDVSRMSGGDWGIEVEFSGDEVEKFQNIHFSNHTLEFEVNHYEQDEDGKWIGLTASRYGIQFTMRKYPLWAGPFVTDSQISCFVDRPEDVDKIVTVLREKLIPSHKVEVCGHGIKVNIPRSYEE